MVVATDGSRSAQAAVRLALEVARSSGREVVFVTVWRQPHADLGIPVRSATEVARSWALDTLAAARREAHEAGVAATSLSRQGRPDREICEVAARLGARMIVLGSHGWGLFEGAFLGSVAHDVLRRAPCPVLVLPDAPWVTREAAATSGRVLSRP
jgi:nucleotide-binding universal stress UspA family protein